MKQYWSCAAMTGALFLSSAGSAAAAPPALIPQPAQLVEKAGTLRIGQGARILVPAGDAEALGAARTLADMVRRTRGLELVVAEAQGVAPAAAIIFLRAGDSADGAEGYALDVAKDGVSVRASTGAGLFHGAMTLAQLLSPDDRFGAPVTLGAMSVRDAPRFAWRGLLLDVARHFLPIDCIESVIDQMAAHKLNLLHLHLTDDQGWRIEIKRYPQLTAIGAWRSPQPGDGAPDARVGGFYTQDQIRALVAYAAARHVTILPEIDMPGHAQAAVASYPELGVFGDRPPVSNSWGVKPYLFGATDGNMAFIRNVLDEVMALFPSNYIHVGGDEAMKDQWNLSPAVQAQIRALGLKDADALQSWFIEQLGQYLAAHGRRLIGWDEILEGGLPASASVMSWRGEKGAIDAANAGHDVVLAPAPTLYLDNLQTRRSDEQPGRLSVVTLRQVYDYDPLPAAIAPGKAGHVLGAEAAVWTELVMTPREVEHATYPRLDAVAEIAWSPREKRDWPGFLTRLDVQRTRYGRLGINAADGAFAVDYNVQGGATAAVRAGRARIELATQAGYGRIRYTRDGRVPTARSPLYDGALDVPLGTVIRAAAFTPDGRPAAAPRTFDTSVAAMLRKDSGALMPCPGERFGLRVPLTTDAAEPLPAYDMNLLDACFVYPQAPLDRVGAITVQVARLPRHYGGAHDEAHVVARYNATAFGELIVRRAGCAGPVMATFPLPDPARSGNRLTLHGALPGGTGDADLCLAFTAPVTGPAYAIDTVALTPG